MSERTDCYCVHLATTSGKSDQLQHWRQKLGSYRQKPRRIINGQFSQWHPLALASWQSSPVTHPEHSPSFIRTMTVFSSDMLKYFTQFWATNYSQVNNLWQLFCRGDVPEPITWVNQCLHSADGKVNIGQAPGNCWISTSSDVAFLTSLGTTRINSLRTNLMCLHKDNRELQIAASSRTHWGDWGDIESVSVLPDSGVTATSVPRWQPC